jgi:uncharacterized membrane protein
MPDAYSSLRGKESDMIRNTLLDKQVGFNSDFRLRGQEVSRLESFSDAVFGFAVTLVVVSLEVPRTFEELQATLLRGFVSFAICFAMLVWAWYGHYRFFRRYGLQDAYTILLNTVLLFVILFYIYPLKFLFTLAANSLFLHLDTSQAIQAQQQPALMMIYGGGFVAVYTIFLLLYFHAYRKREELELNEVEVLRTKDAMLSFVLVMGIGLSSVLIAALGGVKYVKWSGWIYAGIPLVLFISGNVTKRRKRALQKRVTSSEAETSKRSS